MKLISMTDFVLQTVQTPNINEAICLEQTQERLDKIYQYSLLLKQPLKLEMFVTCGEDGYVLEEPENPKKSPSAFKYYDKYVRAKEKVLFEGFEITDETEYLISKYGFSLYFNQIEDFNIEQLLTWSNEIQLTENAIKQIGL